MSFSAASLYSTRFSLLDALLRQSCVEESSGEGQDVSLFPSSETKEKIAMKNPFKRTSLKNQ